MLKPTRSQQDLEVQDESVTELANKLDADYLKMQAEFELITNMLSTNGRQIKKRSHKPKPLSYLQEEQQKPQKRSKSIPRGTIRKPLSEKKIYIEVFDGVASKAQNLSKVFEDLLSELGAKIMTRLTLKTHILVWQYGSMRTLEKVKEIPDIQIVNPCWSDEYNNLINEQMYYTKFPIVALNESQFSVLSQRDKEWFKGQKFVHLRTVEELQLMKEQELRAKSLFVPVWIDIQTQFTSLKGSWVSDYTSMNALKGQQTINFQQSQFTQTLRLLFHKSVYPDKIQQFQHWIDKKFQISSIVTLKNGQEEQASQLIVANIGKYDFTICYFLAKGKDLISYDWCLETQDGEQDISNYRVKTNPITENMFWPFYFCLMHEGPIEDPQYENKVLDIIKKNGGRVLKPAFADICLALNNVRKRQIAKVCQRNIKLKIIRVQWMYESLQRNKILDFDEYRLN